MSQHFSAFLLVLFASLNAAASPNSISGMDLLTRKPVEISASGKKGIVAVFMSAQCPCSNSHAPLVKKLASEFKDFSFVVIHANADEPTETSKQYFSAQSFSFPVIQDSKDKIADEFKAYKTPHAYVIGPDGKVLYKGGVTNSANAPNADKQFLRDALTDVEQGKPVKVSEGRTLGCIISRGEKNVW